MRCSRAQDELSAYLDEELDARAREELRGHLQGCAACRAALDELRRTVESVRALPPAAAPAGFREGVMAKLQETPAPAAEPVETFRAPIWRRLWPVAAAIFVAVMISILYPASRPAHENLRSMAVRPESAPREMEFDKLEPASPATEGSGMLATAPEPDRGYESNALPDYTPAKGGAEAKGGPVATAKSAGDVAVAEAGGAVGKAGASAAMKPGDERLFARADTKNKEVVTNALEDFSTAPRKSGDDGTNMAATAPKDADRPLAKAPPQPTDRAANAAAAHLPEQRAELGGVPGAAAFAPMEIVVVSADPDRARLVARGLLEKRGWLTKEQAGPAAGAAVAKAEAAPPGTIRLSLAAAQVDELRQELARAGLIVMPAMRDQAMQSLRGAVRREEAAAKNAAPIIAQGPQRSPEMAQQRRIPDEAQAVAVEQETQQAPAAPATQQQDVAQMRQDQFGYVRARDAQGALPVLLKFIKAE